MADPLGREIDTRLARPDRSRSRHLVVFNIVSDGLFLTPRNLWNLSVQSAAVAIMATGMVLIIVSRNIDLSVGSILGFTGMFMAMIQAEWLPKTFGLGFDQPYTWIIALAFGLAAGAAIGLGQGFIIAYIGVPSFIVTLGGLLSGAASRSSSPRARRSRQWTASSAPGRRAQGVAGRDAQLGGRRHSHRRDHLQPVGKPPAPAEVRVPGPADVGRRAARDPGVRGDHRRGLGREQLPLGTPPRESQYAAEHGITEPPGGLIIPTGIANPVLSRSA